MPKKPQKRPTHKGRTTMSVTETEHTFRKYREGESPDAEVNELLQQGRDGWWQDTAMFGVIGSTKVHHKDLLIR